MKTYPFIYFGSGASYYEDTFQCCIWFKNKVDQKKLEKFLEISPGQLFSRLFHEQAIYLEIDKDREYEIKALLNKDFKIRLDKNDETIWDKEESFLPTIKEWKSFDHVMKIWLSKMHEKFPIAFVVQLGKLKKGYGEYDAWHQWSLGCFIEEVLPLLQDFYNQKFDQNFAVHVDSMTITFFSEYLKFSRKKSQKLMDQNEQLLKFMELLCSRDGIYADQDIFINEYYINIVFANAKIILQLLEDFDDDKKCEIITNLKPYTQLVLFVGAGDNKKKPALLLFEKPHEYLRTLVQKIEPERKEIISNYIRFMMMDIYVYWRDKKPEEENRMVLLQIVDLALSLPNCNSMTLIRAEIIYEKYGQSEKLKDVQEKIKQASDIFDDDELDSLIN